MRILDQDSDKKLDRVTFYLTMAEAEELRGDLDRLLAKPKDNHAHLSSSDYRKEVTICLYDEQATNSNFDERTKMLIQQDK